MTKSLYDLAEIQRCLSVLFQAGDIVEVRGLDVDRPGSTRVGFFSDHEKAAKAIASLSGHCTGVYVLPNLLDPLLLNRSANVLKPAGRNDCASDTNVIKRRWLYVDFDAKRLTGISSTDAEHQLALNKLTEASTYLVEKIGFPKDSIIMADSGNGAHAVISIDVPLDKETDKLIENDLKALAFLFDTREVTVDQKVFNRARIWKAYGSMACKGSHMPERPHRIAKLLYVSEKIVPTPIDILKKLAELKPEEPKQQRQTSGRQYGEKLDLAKWLFDHDIPIKKVSEWEGWQRYEPECCPFNSSHIGSSVSFFQNAEGAIKFRCEHNSCNGKTWTDVRALKEPGYGQKQYQAPPPSNNGNNEFQDPGLLMLYPTTDIGNAERMAEKYQGAIHYSWERGRWLIWSGKYWEWDNGNRIIEFAIETVRSIYNEAANASDRDARDAIAKHATRSESDSRIEAMVSIARALPGIPVVLGDLDAHPWLFNVNNGTINLKTGQLQPHDSGELHTVLVPVDYDPNAACPQWDRFLDRVTDGRQTVSKYLQRAIGYSLTEDTRQQAFFFLYGAGNNGKSTFIMTVRKMLGACGAKLSIDDLMTRDKKISGAAREGIADLRGKRFVFASEIEQGRKLAVGLIKDLTGGETVKVRRLYEHEVEYLPTYKLWISGNHKPAIADTTLSIWRRLKLIPFPVTIPPQEIDSDLPSKLEAEFPGILAWAVRGCIEYQTRGLTEAIEVRKATASYRHEEDVLADFLEDCCVLESGSNVFITKANLKKLYVEWTQENGVEPLGQKNFKTRLMEKGVGDGFTPDKKHRAWTGIRARTPMDTGQNEGQDGQNDGEKETDGQNRQDCPDSSHMREKQREFMAKPVDSVPNSDSVQNEVNDNGPNF